MNHEGPPLVLLMHHLQQCPPSFLEEPKIKSKGCLNVGAIIGDLLRKIQRNDALSFPVSTLNPASLRKRNLARLRIISAWLLNQEWFCTHTIDISKVISFLEQQLVPYAKEFEATRVITDADRCEEWVRFTLACLDLRPREESFEQAKDRLATLDSIAQRKVIEASRAALEHAREVQEEIARKKAAAAVAAAKAWRE